MLDIVLAVPGTDGVGGALLFCLPVPLHYEGPGVEIPLPAPEDGETNVLFHLKHRFSGLARCLCQMLW